MLKLAEKFDAKLLSKVSQVKVELFMHKLCLVQGAPWGYLLINILVNNKDNPMELDDHSCPWLIGVDSIF